MGLAFVLFTIFNIIVVVFILFYFFNQLIFKRDPAREIPLGSNVVSPADGKIVDIADIKKNDVGGVEVKKGLLGKIYTLTKDVGEECYMVSIFMNLLNVHVNRAPVPGVIEKIRHDKGKFLPAQSLSNGLVNEKNEILIKNDKIGKVKVIQIAGFLARKTECWVKEKQKVVKGQKIGKIKLGSQVTIILPKKVNLKVKKGQKVEAGTSVIAEY